MSQKEIFLEGNPPWGFRMNGGADAGHPLRISRVNPGSKAEAKGVREGDLITSINGQSTKCLTNSESHALLRTVKENLLLGLNEDKNASPRRRSREIKSASIISQEKERSESPAQSKGSKKPSANQKRHQRRTRLKHRIKEMFGIKTRDRLEQDDEDWVVIDKSLKSETKSMTDSLPDEEGHSFVRSSSEPIRNDPEEIYDNFEFNSNRGYSTNKNKQPTTKSNEKNIECCQCITTESYYNVEQNNSKDCNLKECERINVAQSDHNFQSQIYKQKHSAVVENAKDFMNSESKIPNGISDNRRETTLTNDNVSVTAVPQQLSAVEVYISEGEEMSETLNTLPPSEMIEVCNATIMVESDKLNDTSTNACNPIISLVDADQCQRNQNSNPDYEPVEVNSSIIIYPPYSSTLSYYFPQRRYLEAIVEENSDISENNDEKQDKPWENSQQIREANNIDSIPNDWYDSDEGIDTSWRDGRSIEEVTDVPIITDSHSDSEFLHDESKINKVTGKPNDKIFEDKSKGSDASKCNEKKSDVVLGKPPINVVNTYRVSGKQTNKVFVVSKAELQSLPKAPTPLKEPVENKIHQLPISNSVGSKVTCRLLKENESTKSDILLSKENVTDNEKIINTKDNDSKHLMNQPKPHIQKKIVECHQDSTKQDKNSTTKHSCKVMDKNDQNSSASPKSTDNQDLRNKKQTENLPKDHISSQGLSEKNSSNGPKNSNMYFKTTPSASVLKNVVSSYYSSASVPRKVNLSENKSPKTKANVELSTSVIEPGLEKDIELIYIDSSDSEAISASNRTSLSLEKEEEDILERNNSTIVPSSKTSNNSGHIIKEVITNINQSVKEISDICCGTPKAKNSIGASVIKFKGNESTPKVSMLPNLLSPVLTRKCLPTKQKASRRFSYPFSNQDIYLNYNAISCYNFESSKFADNSQTKKGSYSSLQNPSDPPKSVALISKEGPESIPEEVNRKCSLVSSKGEAKSSESVFFDFSDGSISSESYTLPDVTHDNELLSDVSTDTIKYFGILPSSPRFVPRSPVEVSDIVDLHKKFVERRGYHEASPILKRKQEVQKTPEPDLIALSKCQERSEQAYTPELLAEAANLLALRKYHESRQKKMKENCKEKCEESSSESNVKGHSDVPVSAKIQEVATAVINQETNFVLPREHFEQPTESGVTEQTKEDNSSNKSLPVKNETVGKSRLLELFQKLELKSSCSDCTNPEPFPYWLILSDNSVLYDGNDHVINFHVSPNNILKKDDQYKQHEGDKLSQEHEDNKSCLENVTKPEVSIKCENIKSNVSLTEAKPVALPTGEIFQRKMYEEYLGKMAELAERRSSKVIKISSIPSTVNPPCDNQPLELEFMNKLKERNEKLGIVIDSEEIDEKTKDPAPVKQDLPKHLKELMEITEECGDIVGKDGLLVEIDEALSPERKGFLTAKGVWSPAQTPEAERKKFDFSNEIKEEKEKKEEDEKKEPQPAVWTPRSAGASPTLERKFRSVNFQSPPPTRKEIKTSNENTPELPQELPPESDKDTKSRLISSSSENSTLSSSLKLPAAQNPTITLLQKAREGQIPRGAQYLEEQPIIGPNEIIYSVKKEHVSEDQSRKIVELGPRKIAGIGPTTKEGIPTVLRSEVKEDNQQRWYKRMYDSLHKADYDKDFVTVKYKTKRRGQYPYIYAGGYSSEPERVGYDSDASLSKYATLDRRKIRNKENDFTTSTMPRNRYAPGVKYAVNVYKNQPGRIEDYEPGHSSIAERETKQWWDEVMDIFDGELNDHPRHHLSAKTSGKPFTYSLKDTGYESDSTLVFKRRENNMSGQLLSPADQKMAYKVIQKGGEVPLQGLRKAAPERPKEDSEIEYFPLSPTLTRIRVHKRSPKPKEKVFYPMSEDVTYASLRRSSRSVVPSPPRRESSKYSSTLKYYTHAGTSSPEIKAEYIKDKVVTQLPSRNSVDVKIEKSGKVKSTLVKYEPSKSPYGIIKQKKEMLRKSPELKAPAEVKKALKDSKTPSGTMVKSSTTLYSSARNKKPKEDKSLKVTVAISTKGKDLLTSSSSASSKSDFRKSPLLTKPSVKVKSTLDSKPVSPPLLKAPRPSSRSSLASTTVSTEQPKKIRKEIVIDPKKKKEKKFDTSSKSSDKCKEEEKKKLKKKQENGKKRNGSKKKDKENIPQEPADKPEEIELSEPPRQQDFFQKLLLRESNSPNPSVTSTTVSRTPSVLERVKKFTETQDNCYKSEPSLRNLNVYLSQKRPVTESRFRSLDRHPSRALSPFYGTYDFYDKIDKFDKHNNVWDCSLTYSSAPNESVKSRSSSEPPHTSPTLSQEVCENTSVSPSTSRSPSCRRIRRPASRAIETISGVRRKFRSKSLNETDRQSQMGSTSSLCLSQYTDHEEYKSYVLELLHSTRKSEKFKELHKFYSSLERMGELEKTTSNTDLRPRLKNEEVIDFDRWKQLRNKEKAEQELNFLYEKLKDDQREKGFLFQPKETVRWTGDSGLRHKEKSVEDLRLQYQRMVESSSSEKKQALDPSKDVYKPLWRGSSVANLASSLTSVTGSKRGRPVKETHQSLIKPPPKKDKDIGGRLWSSLSMEQVNALKNQLSEIYSTVSNLKHERIQKMKQNLEDYEVNITGFSRGESPLHVRCNSLVSPDQLYSPAVKKRASKRQECMKADSIGTLPHWKSKPLSENEKRKLSMSLSAEVKERIKKRKHGTLVIPRETLGAVAAIKGSKKLKSPCNSETSPRTCYSLLSDESTDKGDEKNKDFLLVLTPKDQKDEVKKMVDNWGTKEYARVVQTTSSSSSSASTVIHLGYKDDLKSSASKANDFSQSQTDLRQETESQKINRKALHSSQSFTDLKDLFGEKNATAYSTLPLRNIKKPCFSSSESLYKSISPDPMKYYRAYLNVVKAGDVRKLKEKFESYDDIYNLRKARSPVQKLYQSDPDLTRDFLSRKGGEMSKVVVKGQEVGDVQWLRRKYEPRKVSPIPFKVEDRYMPHINVISKTATLQRRSHTPPSRVEVAKTGNVERLKQQYEKRGMSLLGQMYTSTPEITELRDIAPYLECEWVAHQNPRRSESKRKIRSRPASASPVRQSILKQTDIFANQEFNPEIHRPLYRYQPEPWQSKTWVKPTVTFKEPLGNPIPTPPRDSTSRQRIQESPHRYVESEVNIHYRSPVRREAKAAWPEDELAQRQAEIMRRIYQEQKRTKYLNELHDMYSRRHADNLLPSQKSPIPLNRYDDFPVEPQPPRPRDRTPEPKLVARALYNFVGQTSRELTFRRGDIIYVRRQIDKNWYEGEHNAMVGLFPFNYVEIIPYDGIRTLPKKANEGQARAKFNFQAQTHLELSLVKGELVLLTRRVDENWFEGRIGNRKGIFPVSYVEVLVEPGERAASPSGGISPSKPIVAPASHSVMLNGAKDLGQQHYQPPRPAIYASSSLPPSNKMNDISLVNQTLHIDTQSDPVPYRVMYNYRPQNEDELELKEGDIVYVMEKCDDGWYVGSLHRNGQFGTFPGNYVERIQ